MYIYNIYSYILYTEYSFLLFKASAFLQIFFLRKTKIEEVLRTSVFLISKCLTLKTSDKKHIPLLIDLFISLIELEHLLKTSNKRTHL